MYFVYLSVLSFLSDLSISLEVLKYVLLHPTLVRHDIGGIVIQKNPVMKMLRINYPKEISGKCTFC